MPSYEILSKPGERKYNEDFAGAEQKGGAFCFVLADGLGGHGGGDEASRLVAEHILRDFKAHGEVTETYLKECFDGSQRRLLEEQRRQNRELEMKTTLVVLLMDEDTKLWGHVGDSRLYVFRNKKFAQRTLDHSVPQMLVAAGKIKEAEIRRHPDRNRLLRVMGTEWDTPRYQIEQPAKRNGDEVFLLCSDGFWEWIEEKRMQKALRKSKSPAEWLAQMEKDVLKNGLGKGMDNYTAVAVFMDSHEL